MFVPIVLALWTGLTAGAAHVMAGPDHLAAIAPLAATRRRQAWFMGLQWSLGHASGVVVIGMLSLLLRDAVPIDLFSSFSERLVGIFLIGIGLWGIRQGLRHRVHTHPHTHNGFTHTHIHLHQGDTAHLPGLKKDPSHGSGHSHAVLGIGCLHGLAGGSHFIGVLPALAFSTMTQAVLYLVAYGAGTMLCMTVFSSVIAEVARRTQFFSARAYGAFVTSCSALAVVIGGYWLLG